MTDFEIHPSHIEGEVRIPSSKSHTLRAILFGLMAKGKTRIHHPLPSPDSRAMIDAIQQLGANVSRVGTTLEIEGTGGNLKPAENVIQAGNSGQVLRFIGALSALLPTYTVITGDASIRHRRPVKPLLEALNQVGVFAESSRGDGRAPIIIKGPLISGKMSLDGEDSQPVSGLLISSCFAKGPVEINVENPGEKPWIDLTLSWLDRLGLKVENHGYTNYRIPGGGQIEGFEYTVPGDFSTAAFPIVAALIHGKKLTLHNLDMKDAQGDKKLIDVLVKMGANIEIDLLNRVLMVGKSPRLKGMTIDVNDFIDSVPILAVLGCFTDGRLEIRGAKIARQKECDRLSAMHEELRKMGAAIEEKEDGLVVHPTPLKGARLNTYSDHRIVMALSVAAMGAKGPSVVQNTKSVTKTYPAFLEDFQSMGAKLKVIA